jgi:hypothetical protein
MIGIFSKKDGFFGLSHRHHTFAEILAVDMVSEPKMNGLIALVGGDRSKLSAANGGDEPWRGYSP